MNELHYVGRWILAVPLAIVSAIAINFLLVIIVSIAHGFDAVSTLFAALDMNGMPISGTYILLATRASTAAVLVAVIAYVVPAFRTRVAIGSGIVVAIVSVGLFGYVIWAAIAAEMGMTVSMWYRAVLELLSLLAGSAIGAAIGADPSEKTRTGVTLSRS